MERNKIPTELIIKYCDFSKEIFKFLLNNIFQNDPYSRNLQLELHVFDVYNKNLGTCDYPKIINVFIGDILELFSYEDFFYKTALTDSYVKSIITEVIMHEILHSNRVLNMNKYECDQSYHDNEEAIICKQTIALMINCRQIIKNYFGFDLRIELFMDITPGPYNNTGYSINSLEMYYKIMIQNTVPQLREKIDVFFSSYNNIILFNKSNNSTSKALKLKTEGVYNIDALYEFQNLSCFDGEGMMFNVFIGCSSDNKTGFITIETTNNNLYPMIFKE